MISGIARSVAVVVALTLVAPGAAIAQPKKPAAADAGERQRKAEGQKLAAKGRAALAAKRYEEAEEALRGAHEIAPTPQLELDRARALVGLKRYADARAILGALADGGSSPGAKQVAAAAKAQLTGLERRAPGLKVSVVGPSSAEVHVSVDGEVVDASREIPLDPGEHVVTADAPGFYRGVRKVKVADGQHLSEELTLTPEEKVAPPAQPAVVASRPVESPDAHAGASGSVVPALIAFGLGAAGVGVGIGFGVMASSQGDDVKAQCNGTACPPSVEGDLDSARTKGNISTVGFAVGGAGVVAGVVLLIVRPGGRASVGEGREAFVSPWIGPAMGGARGAF